MDYGNELRTLRGYTLKTMSSADHEAFMAADDGPMKTNAVLNNQLLLILKILQDLTIL